MKPQAPIHPQLITLWATTAPDIKFIFCLQETTDLILVSPLKVKALDKT
jgi:hypothetical protein